MLEYFLNQYVTCFVPSTTTTTKKKKKKKMLHAPCPSIIKKKLLNIYLLTL